MSKDCPRPKTCHACRSTDHLLKDCPKRGGAGGGGAKDGTVASRTERARPSSSAGEGASTGPQRGGGKEAVLKGAEVESSTKGGARTGSQAFTIPGPALVSGPERKKLKEKETEVRMDSTLSGEEMTAGGLEGMREMVLGQPLSLSGPVSPLNDEGTDGE